MARVLLGVTGSVAAVRAPSLYQALTAAGHSVLVAATRPSLYFFDPNDLAAAPPPPEAPAGGPVRIIIQNAVQATPAMYDRIRAEIAETRREEGCAQYAWYESVDRPGHVLLLEVWADQVFYDRNWALRGATAAFVGDNLRTPAEPQRGPWAREFYRWQEFRHHYDRWLPADPGSYATTVSWPAS